jgi:hypothetical protein
MACLGIGSMFLLIALTWSEAPGDANRHGRYLPRPLEVAWPCAALPAVLAPQRVLNALGEAEGLYEHVQRPREHALDAGEMQSPLVHWWTTDTSGEAGLQPASVLWFRVRVPQLRASRRMHGALLLPR